MPNGSLQIKILGREYKISCPAEREVDLLRAADFLNTRMTELKKSGNIIGLERIAMITALNLADEILRADAAPVVDQTANIDQANEQINRLQKAVIDSNERLADSVK